MGYASIEMSVPTSNSFCVNLGSAPTGSVQSSTSEIANEPLDFSNASFCRLLNVKLSCMMSRSVRTTSACQTADAARPSKPVPDPSSSICGFIAAVEGFSSSRM